MNLSDRVLSEHTVLSIKNTCVPLTELSTIPPHSTLIRVYQIHGGDNPNHFTNSPLMRKIESQMIDAIKSETDWKSGNTKVVNFFNDGDKCVVTSVFLHDNLIAEIQDDSVMIFDGGWQTTTTKSRLNALCDEFCIAGEGVFQKNFQWYVRLFTGAINGKNVYTTKEFTNGFTFA